MNTPNQGLVCSPPLDSTKLHVQAAWSVRYCRCLFIICPLGTRIMTVHCFFGVFFWGVGVVVVVVGGGGGFFRFSCQYNVLANTI